MGCAVRHCAKSPGVLRLLATSLAGDFTESNEAGDRIAVDKGVVTSRAGSIKDLAEAFVSAIALHRHWERETGP